MTHHHVGSQDQLAQAFLQGIGDGARHSGCDGHGHKGGIQCPAFRQTKGDVGSAANRKTMPNADFTKWVKPEDLANVVLFLSSDEAKTITGAAIPTFGIA